MTSDGPAAEQGPEADSRGGQESVRDDRPGEAAHPRTICRCTSPGRGRGSARHDPPGCPCSAAEARGVPLRAILATISAVVVFYLAGNVITASAASSC